MTIVQGLQSLPYLDEAHQSIRRLVERGHREIVPVALRDDLIFGSVVSPHAGLLPGGQAKETSPAKPNPNVVDLPSQPPSALVLRQPRESAQYVAILCTERLLEAGVEPSVGSVGDSYDNALAETINGLFKTEVIRRRGPWRNMEAVEFATLEWVDWFNNHRLLEPIGNIPPAEAEARYYAAQQEITLAA